jgi:hypothetical protein
VVYGFVFSLAEGVSRLPAHRLVFRLRTEREVVVVGVGYKKRTWILTQRLTRLGKEGSRLSPVLMVAVPVVIINDSTKQPRIDRYSRNCLVSFVPD